MNDPFFTLKRTPKTPRRNVVLHLLESRMLDLLAGSILAIILSSPETDEELLTLRRLGKAVGATPHDTYQAIQGLIFAELIKEVRGDGEIHYLPRSRK